MHRSLRRAVTALGLSALVFASPIDAQLRSIVTKSVSASSSGASLVIEFDDRASLDIAFDDGAVYVDGDRVGSYAPGGTLDDAWRGLLGDAMGLENGALAQRLLTWTPPEDEHDGDVARLIDATLEESLAADRDSETDGDESSASTPDDGDRSLRRLLARSMGRLGVLEDALQGIEDDFEVHIDEDVTIERDTERVVTLVMIDGTLTVEGTVRGDVVLVGGALDVRDDGLIDGEVRVADTRIVRDDGEVRGGIIDVLEGEQDLERARRSELRDEIRREIRDDLRREIRTAARVEDRGFSLMAPFRPVVRGVSGVVEKLVAVFLIGLLGAGFMAFAGQNVDAISETARRAPGRAAMVGFAGSFLLIPVWLLGALALIVSIIGIPVAVAWLPLFPLAAILAALLGFVAVARNTGEWMADSRMPWTGWIRKSNPVFTLFGGLLGLSALFVAGHLLSIVPILGALSVLLFVVGSIVALVAMQIGFGAVLLTRAGRKREYTGRYDPDAAWAAAMTMDIEDDAGVSRSKTTGEGR